MAVPRENETDVVTVLEQAADWPVERVAVGVTDVDGALDTYGPTGDVFPLASVTKLLSAYAALVAVDQGRLELDEVVDDRGATPRHLLAHAAGYPMSGHEPRTDPGTRRIYSNTGFEELASLVADRVGRSFERFLHQQVLLPLGLGDTQLDGSPAAGANGTVDDLLVFARELLEPTLIDPELAADATTPQFADLDGVLPGFGRQEPNHWGLGFELRGSKDPHWTGAGNSPTTFGHFGQSGSFLWVDPEHGIATACLADRDFGDWAVEHWPSFNDAVLDAYGG